MEYAGITNYVRHSGGKISSRKWGKWPWAKALLAKNQKTKQKKTKKKKKKKKKDNDRVAYSPLYLNIFSYQDSEQI